MKPRNFPARKLRRQLVAQHDRFYPYSDEGKALLAEARKIRTKKRQKVAQPTP